MQEEPVELEQTWPAPGIYDNICDAEYRRVGWLSNSSLCKAAMPREDSPKSARNMLVGTALHEWWREPDGFKEKVAVMPWDGDDKPDRRSKAFKDNWGLFRLNHDEPFVLDPIEGAELRGMAAALTKDAEAMAIRKATAMREVMIVWVDPATGVVHKMLGDNLGKQGAFVVDLKSTAHATPGDFEAWTVQNPKFGYESQIAMYHDAVALQHMGKPTKCAWVVASKTGDFRVWIHKARPEHIIKGRGAYRLMAASYKARFPEHDCITKGAEYVGK